MVIKHFSTYCCFRGLPSSRNGDGLWADLQRQLSDAYLLGLRKSILEYALRSPSVNERYGLGSTWLLDGQQETKYLARDEACKSGVRHEFIIELESVYSSRLLEMLSGWSKIVEGNRMESVRKVNIGIDAVEAQKQITKKSLIMKQRQKRVQQKGLREDESRCNKTVRDGEGKETSLLMSFEEYFENYYKNM